VPSYLLNVELRKKKKKKIRPHARCKRIWASVLGPRDALGTNQSRLDTISHSHKTEYCDEGWVGEKEQELLDPEVVFTVGASATVIRVLDERAE